MGILFLILIVIGAFVVLSLAGWVIFDILLPLLVWAFIGWLANRLIHGRGYGVWADMGLGLVGGIVGSILFPGGGLLHGLIFGTLGAVIVIFIGKLLNGSRPAV